MGAPLPGGPMFVTRFAPSPTGPLHLGHAYSAILAHDMARAAGGRFLLRMEDTDLERCRPEWDALIQDDIIFSAASQALSASTGCRSRRTCSAVRATSCIIGLRSENIAKRIRFGWRSRVAAAAAGVTIACTIGWAKLR